MRREKIKELVENKRLSVLVLFGFVLLYPLGLYFKYGEVSKQDEVSA